VPSAQKISLMLFEFLRDLSVSALCVFVLQLYLCFNILFDVFEGLQVAAVVRFVIGRLCRIMFVLKFLF